MESTIYDSLRAAGDEHFFAAFLAFCHCRVGDAEQMLPSPEEIRDFLICYEIALDILLSDAKKSCGLLQ